MSNVLEFAAAHKEGVTVILLLAFATVGLVQWVAWIFQRGRFRVDATQPANARPASNPLRFVAANFFVEIINDFRHLLALVVVAVFALALAIAMYPGLRHWNVDQIGEGVEAVAAALGGLIGSIIGYYFGESAAARTAQRPVRETPPIHDLAGDADAQRIKPAPPPPAERTEPPS